MNKIKQALVFLAGHLKDVLYTIGAAIVFILAIIFISDRDQLAKLKAKLMQKDVEEKVRDKEEQIEDDQQAIGTIDEKLKQTEEEAKRREEEAKHASDQEVKDFYKDR